MLEIIDFEEENNKFNKIIMRLKEDLKGIQLEDNSMDLMQKSDLIEQFLDSYLDQDKTVQLVSMLFRSFLE